MSVAVKHARPRSSRRHLLLSPEPRPEIGSCLGHDEDEAKHTAEAMGTSEDQSPPRRVPKFGGIGAVSLCWTSGQRSSQGLEQESGSGGDDE